MANTSLPAAIVWPDDARRERFTEWLATAAQRHGFDLQSLRAASADASFRRYFRVEGAGRSFIVMDAPPPQEDVRPFVAIAAMLEGAGLNAPRVLEQDAEHGFLLLSDLGSQLYLQALQQAQSTGDLAGASVLMRDATAALVQWQTRADASGLPPYDDALLRRELQLFPDWCVAKEYGVTWTPEQQARWDKVCDLLVKSALAQPTVAVHRDYMPRNLMICPPEVGNPGILDFQDAVRGPITYDVASLLRDAFISWEEEQEIDWAVRYWQAARKASLPVPEDFGDFWRQLEWMGLQRHLKVLGIFCRLKHRDGKPNYSQDLPRFFRYAHKVAVRYNGLGPLAHQIEPLMGATRKDAFY
ncbi:aminoglycoside phosphotransferase family protein [Piscinibacter sp. HJYY11]|uniref:aminoglycoside phosphotransferase family protein n=1 Tax=Piscinibacter sp. HJYY11 TaxID=2801333 RepID=UPI00191D1870|nr:phosphotransferase [Piscinibacter sp. HJYY11]MBL0729484.1 phosphotransferase [Piscinibacter sp. HJYY11]